MDKIVRRVTVVEREGAHKKAKVVYNAVDDEEDDEDEPSLHPLERRVRRLLKANLVQAQEAYQQHLSSVAKGGSAWVYDSPRNLMRARRKAMKDLHKSGPFKTPDSDDDEED